MRPPIVRRVAAAVVLAVLAVFIGVVAMRAAPKQAEGNPGVVHYDQGSLRYTYHLVSGTEGLFDLDADPRGLENLVTHRPDDARRLRQLLQVELGVGSLEELRAPYRDTIERLRALGYL